MIEGIAVAMGFNPEGGTVNFNFSTNASHSDLHDYLTVCRGYKWHKDGFFLRAESFYNVASNIDEPEAALSPMRLMRLMVCMQKLVENNSQFIISTHSPILMTFPDAEVLEITETGIQPVHFKNTEHYIVTKRFVDAPEKMVKNLFEGE